MNERPEWVRCIRRNHVAHDKESWCGKSTYGFDKPFLDVDHAAENGLQGGRLVACRECVTAATAALQNGHDDPEYPAQS